MKARRVHLNGKTIRDIYIIKSPLILPNFSSYFILLLYISSKLPNRFTNVLLHHSYFTLLSPNHFPNSAPLPDTLSISPNTQYPHIHDIPSFLLIRPYTFPDFQIYLPFYKKSHGRIPSSKTRRM